MAKSMPTLRNEIIESEKARIDLLKWKLILVASLGALGLGINISSQSNEPLLSLHLLLSLIPLVCVYVDLLCKHLQIRILVIGKFFKEYPTAPFDKELSCFSSYEEFCDRQKVRSVFALEDWAQELSTIVISILLIMAARLPKISQQDSQVIIFSGVFGIVVTLLIKVVSECKKTSLNDKR